MKYLFIDMDGTVAEYRTFISEDQYLQEGYYSSLRTMKNVVDALTLLKDEDIGMFIISACPNKLSVIDEKNEWLDRFLPFIAPNHRIFTLIGENKSEKIKSVIGPLTKECFLYDDYKKNINEWVNGGGSAIKSLNGLNSEPKTKRYSALSANQDPKSLAEKLKRILFKDEIIHDTMHDVQLRNETLGTTLILSLDELTNIVSRYFKDDYINVEDFRKHFTNEDWNFIKRLSSDAIIEQNTTVAQFVFENETFSKTTYGLLKGIIEDFNDSRDALNRTEVKMSILETKIEYLSTDIMSRKGNKRRVRKIINELKNDFRRLFTNMLEQKAELNHVIDSDIVEIKQNAKEFFGKYENFEIGEDEEFEDVFSHAKENFDIELTSVEKTLRKLSKDSCNRIETVAARIASKM